MTDLIVNEDWNDAKFLQLIKNLKTPGFTNEEFHYCATVAKERNLSPLKDEIYFIKRGGKVTITVSIGGLRKIANNTGRLHGMENYWCGPDGIWHDVWVAAGNPAAAKTVILLKDGGTVTGVAVWKEHAQTSPMWTKYPSTMLAKCAEAQAIRKAFSETAGLYTTDEMPVTNVITENQRASVHAQVLKVKELVSANANSVLNDSTGSAPNKTIPSQTKVPNGSQTGKGLPQSKTTGDAK